MANDTNGYAPVDGLEMYCEVHGTGQPLVLLHGNLSTIEVDFGRIIPTLAKTRQVIAVEQQAHGHTADIDRPLRIQHYFLGYSSGSAVAFQIAIQRPELVRKLVLCSFAHSRGGIHPGILDGIQQIQPEHLAGTPFAESYARVAPRPQDWPVLIGKIKEMDSSVPEWPAETVKTLGKPTMLVIGDSDIIRPEHAAETFRLLGGGVAGDIAGLPSSRLAVLPGTTHITLVHRGDWLASMVEEFLDAP